MNATSSTQPSPRQPCRLLSNFLSPKTTILRGLALAACCFSCVAVADDVTVAKYFGGKAGALSFTFDDGSADHYTLAFPELKKRGLKATFAICGSFIEKDTNASQVTWAQLREMVADGQDIANHGYAHKRITQMAAKGPDALAGEVETNDLVILERVGVKPESFVYAYGDQNPQTIAYCERGRVGARHPIVWLGGGSVKSGKMNPDLWFGSHLDRLIANGGWTVTLTHGIASGYDCFDDPKALWKYFDDACERTNKLWVATFADVMAYTKERDHMVLTVKPSGSQGLDITPMLALDKAVFNRPLTLELGKRNLAKVQATQGSKKLKVYGDQERALVDIDPWGGVVSVRF